MITCVSNLAITLDNHEKWEEAEGMHRRALEGHEKVLGKDHPSTLTSLNNLGCLLKSQGKLEAAEDATDPGPDLRGR